MKQVCRSIEQCKDLSGSLLEPRTTRISRKTSIALFCVMLLVLTLPLSAQTFDWELTTTSDDGNVNGGKVYSTVGDISVEVSSTVSAGGLYISLFDMSSYPSYGASGYIAFASVTNVQSITFDFTAGGPVDIQSIYAVEVGGSPGAWTYTPAGGSNSPVTDNISASTGKEVTLNWTDITSFTVTKSEALSGFGFDDMVLGSSEPPAPITLTSFTGNVNTGSVELSWETASETNNACFVIYRNDEMVTSIEGAGTTSEPHNYSFTDNTVIPGVIYTYVLADVDYANTETKYDDLAVTVSINNDLLNKNFVIGNPYPNPFNPETTLPLTLNSKSKVQIDLYDLSGHKVKSLLNATMDAGAHMLDIDASDLMSGTYLVKVKIDNKVNMRKIILVK